MTAMPATLGSLDITQAGFFLQPDYYETLAWLRANRPVHRLESSSGIVLVSRYDDIREISRDPARFTSRRGALVNDPVRAVEPNDEAGSLLHLDPPLHADYRKLLNREFTPRAVAKMEATVRRIVAEALDRLDAGGPVDLVETVALPIPVRVIAELIGMAHFPLEDVRRWSDATIAVTDGPTEQVMVDVIEFAGVLAAHVAERFEAAASGQPIDDLIGLLAASQVGDTPLTPAQVELFCMTLMVAGNETTRSLISGGALALAEHPDQRAALAAAIAVGDDAAVNAAVEECLRWVTPIQAFCRTATQDLELSGTAVQAGDYLVLLYASGNRDESVFGPTADRFDVTRPATPAHVAFGFGEHLCLGAALARLEARIVFEELLRRFPRYELVGEPSYTPSTLTRSIDVLPVSLG
jgi:cytochrome P450